METVSQGPGSRAGWAGTETSEAAGDPSWHNERSSSFVNQGSRESRNYNLFDSIKISYYTPTVAVLMSHIILLLFFNSIEFIVNSSEC